MQFPRIRACLSLFILLTPGLLFGYFNFRSNDPWPIYDAAAEPHQFLTERLKEIIFKGYETFRDPARFGLAITAFGQGAHHGKNDRKQKVPIADLQGPWNMLALLFNEDCIPESGLLRDAFENGRYFQQIEVDGEEVVIPGPLWSSGEQELQDQIFDNHVSENFGTISIGLDYRKYGLRGELMYMLTDQLGIMVQAGVSDIQVTATTFQDQSTIGFVCPPVDICDDENSTITQRENVRTVREMLTNEQTFKQIARELGFDVCNFHQAGIEDLKLTAFWRKVYDLSEISYSWPNVLLTPFFTAYFVAGIGKKICTSNNLFGIPQGNNGHQAGGFNGGFSLDFHDTVEFIAEVGGTWFSQKEYKNMPIPNDVNQVGLFKCRADVTLKPGANWYVNGNIHARYFMGHLSFYLQYVLLTHTEDKFFQGDNECCFPNNPINVFLDLLRCRSSWWSRFVNAALYYDITPNLSAGFLWQAPLDERNAFRTTTIAFSIRGVY